VRGAAPEAAIVISVAIAIGQSSSGLHDCRFAEGGEIARGAQRRHAAARAGHSYAAALCSAARCTSGAVAAWGRPERGRIDGIAAAACLTIGTRRRQGGCASSERGRGVQLSDCCGHATDV
jgi:hypothetical protein